MKSVFLDRDTFSLSDQELQPLWHGLDHLATYSYTSDQDALERCLPAEIIFTNKVIMNSALLEQLPELKYIGVLATGTNNVDVEWARSKNIHVQNVAGYSTDSVAQHVFGFMLSLATGVHTYSSEAKLWPQSKTFTRLEHVGFQLKHKTIGIIGYGTIGREVERLAKSFGMDVVICESFSGKNPAGRVPLEELLQQSDFVSLHCPLSEKTDRLVNKDFLHKMKPNSYLINTARGPIVNEQDLALALKNKVIAGAALDVLQQEPPAADHPLINLQHPQLIITPHTAWASREAQLKLIALARENLEHFLNSSQSI